MEAKPRFVLVTDPAEAEALRANGKYREDRPHWVFRAGQLWVLVDEQFQKWRLARTSKGEQK